MIYAGARGNMPINFLAARPDRDQVLQRYAWMEGVLANFSAMQKPLLTSAQHAKQEAPHYRTTYRKIFEQVSDCGG